MTTTLASCVAWRSAFTAPFDQDLELAVTDDECMLSLVFPCRRVLHGWMDSETEEIIDVSPTHWREWTQGGGRSQIQG